MSATTGPWILNPVNAQVDSPICSEYGGLLPICQLLWPTDERSEAETYANGHLIAAAPWLYDAAVDTVEAFVLLRMGLRDNPAAIEVIDAHLDELRTAIAKAEGRDSDAGSAEDRNGLHPEGVAARAEGIARPESRGGLT